ncbi:glycosyltransferase [Flavobacterium agricola]|uniref:Glycosyltransferase n=1 Tax=Flavobacterium agricola TaxID=2870839 RepID=A0ABY6M1F5_9FLAO|nr:glycosyltransferase [Flavobacterium agricola]UYW01545.1 glycosyltransferase [Flavobacterium agricola]
MVPIYFITPDESRPTGGVKQIYKQVEILNANGFDAYVVHQNKKFKINWFQHNVPTKYFPKIYLDIEKYRKKGIYYQIKFFFKKLFTSSKLPDEKSVLVLPEVLAKNLKPDLYPNQRVIFNQNCYYTFLEKRENNTFYEIYEDALTLATIVVSENSKQYLQFAFPDIDVQRIRIGIDKPFTYHANKHKQIAYMPRKLGDDLFQLIQILKNKPAFKEWEFVAINNKTEIEVAQILQNSAIYLSTNWQEGFGLPPAEAMRCGCYVIGYTGNAGTEYFNDVYSITIENGAILDFAQAVEQAVVTFNSNPDFIIEKGKKASDFITETYTKTLEANDIITFWTKLLK